MLARVTLSAAVVTWSCFPPGSQHLHNPHRPRFPPELPRQSRLANAHARNVNRPLHRLNGCIDKLITHTIFRTACFASERSIPRQKDQSDAKKNDSASNKTIIHEKEKISAKKNDFHVGERIFLSKERLFTKKNEFCQKE
jgi:hypothetical protein